MNSGCRKGLAKDQSVLGSRRVERDKNSKLEKAISSEVNPFVLKAKLFGGARFTELENELYYGCNVWKRKKHVSLTKY